MTPEEKWNIIQSLKEVIKILVLAAIKRGHVQFDELDNAISWATSEAFDIISTCRSGNYERHLRHVLSRRLRAWRPPEQVSNRKSIENHAWVAPNKSGGSGGAESKVEPTEDLWARLPENPDDDLKDGDAESWDRLRQEGKWWDTSDSIEAQALRLATPEVQARVKDEAYKVLLKRVDEPGRLRGGTHHIARLRLAGFTVEEAAAKTGRNVGWVKKADAEIARRLDTPDVEFATRRRSPRQPRPRQPQAKTAPVRPEPVETKTIIVDGKPVLHRTYPMVEPEPVLLYDHLSRDGDDLSWSDEESTTSENSSEISS